MSTTVKVILGFVAAGVLFVVALVVFVFNVTAGVVDAGDAFMKKLQAKDYPGAISMCTPALQTELGGAEGLQKGVEGSNLTPTDWSFSSRSINNGTGKVEGTLTSSDGRSHPVRLVMESENDTWKITGVSISAE